MMLTKGGSTHFGVWLNVWFWVQSADSASRELARGASGSRNMSLLLVPIKKLKSQKCLGISRLHKNKELKDFEGCGFIMNHEVTALYALFSFYFA